VIPIEPSGVGRMMKMIIFIFLKVVVGIGIAYYEETFSKFKEKRDEKE
jgi:hypothetical protein